MYNTQPCEPKLNPFYSQKYRCRDSGVALGGRRRTRQHCRTDWACERLDISFFSGYNERCFVFCFHTFMQTLTVELLNPQAKTILSGLEDAGLIAINQMPVLPSRTALRSDNADDFWHQKSVDELAEEQGVAPIDNLERLFGCGKDLWETDKEWSDYMEQIQATRREAV
jgi:hypothetical protein